MYNIGLWENMRFEISWQWRFMLWAPWLRRHLVCWMDTQLSRLLAWPGCELGQHVSRESWVILFPSIGHNLTKLSETVIAVLKKHPVHFLRYSMLQLMTGGCALCYNESYNNMYCVIYYLILCNSSTGDTFKIHVAWKTEVC